MRRDDQEQRQQDVHDKGHRDAVYLAALVVVLFGISIFWSSHTATTAAQGRAQIEQKAIVANQRLISAQEKAISAACDFWYPLTSLPVTVNAATGKPTPLGVQIIAGARESYAGQCAGAGHPQMPPPDPTLVKWAAYYHLLIAR